MQAYRNYWIVTATLLLATVFAANVGGFEWFLEKFPGWEVRTASPTYFSVRVFLRWASSCTPASSRSKSTPYYGRAPLCKLAERKLFARRASQGHFLTRKSKPEFKRGNCLFLFTVFVHNNHESSGKRQHPTMTVIEVCIDLTECVRRNSRDNRVRLDVLLIEHTWLAQIISVKVKPTITSLPKVDINGLQIFTTNTSTAGNPCVNVVRVVIRPTYLDEKRHRKRWYPLFSNIFGRTIDMWDRDRGC